jgi:hypothetical protein
MVSASGGSFATLAYGKPLIRCTVDAQRFERVVCRRKAWRLSEGRAAAAIRQQLERELAILAETGKVSAAASRLTALCYWVTCGERR